MLFRSESEHELVAVVSNPEKRMGRGKQLSHTPVGKFAVENELPLVQAESLTDPTFIERLKSYNADLNILVAYRILPQVLIDLPTKGSINLHASLLPKYRGAAPIHRAILNGDIKSGVTTMIMDKGMDTGDILLVDETPIEQNDDAQSLHDKLSEQGAELVLETLSRLQKNDLLPIPQNSEDRKSVV